MEIRNLGSSGLRSRRSPTATGSRTGRRSRRSTRSPACGGRSTRASPPSTPPTSTPTRAPSRSWGGPGRRAPRGPGDLHEGLLADRAGSPQRPRPVPQAHHGVDPRIAEAARHRLRRPLPGAPLRRRDAAGGDDGGLRRRRPAGQGPHIGVSEWTADQIRAAHGLARELRVPLVSNQPQYNLLWRVIESEVVPTCEELGLGQVVFSPIAQGALTGKYLPGQPPEARARPTTRAART